MSEFGARLKKLKANWGKAKTREGGSFESPVEDGVYKMRVTDCEVGESQGSGRLQIHWGYTVAEGEFKGETVHDYDGLETEDNLFFVQRKLAKLGKEVPESPDEIEAICKEVAKEKPLIRGRVKTKEDYTHVYINRLLDNDGTEVEAPEEEAPAEEVEEQEEQEVEEPKESGEVALEQGMKVSFASGGKTLEGEILEFVDDDSKARVKTDKGTFKVAVEKLTPAEGDAEPEEPEVEPEEDPKPAPRKSAATATATRKGSVVKKAKR